jgi:hypothetical protein
MTFERTLSHCQQCGKAHCPEEGGPECDCFDGISECEFCGWMNDEFATICYQCGAWKCEECGEWNEEGQRECEECGTDCVPKEGEPAYYLGRMSAQAGDR